MVCLTQNAKTAYSDFFCAADSAQSKNVNVNENPVKGLRESIYDVALDLRVCGGAQVLTEYENGLEKQSYVYASYVDDPIALIKADGTKYFYQSNHLFSVEALTDSSGDLIETYDYNSYGKMTIRDSLGVVQASSAVGNVYGFTGRRLDSESGLYYFRARYFDVELGRFIARDPLGYVDGMSVYSGYFVSDGVDPSGLIVVAIAGTSSRKDRAKDIHGHVENFDSDYQGRHQYFDGPDSVIFGSDSGRIQEKAMEWLAKEWCKDRTQPIDLVGHSRGAYIVMQMAREIESKGIKCGCDTFHPRVRFMGLYDPVDSAPGYGDGNDIPGNVDRVRVAFSDPEVHSRTIFHRVGYKAEAGSDYDSQDFRATHAGMGGAPWAGDHPRTSPRDYDGSRIKSHPRITQPQDVAGSKQVDNWMRSQATGAGVNLKP